MTTIASSPAKKLRTRKPMTDEQKLAKREYDRRWRPLYAERAKVLRQKPERKAAAARAVSAWKARPEKWLIVLFANARYRAHKKGIVFTIQPQDIEIVTVCPILGIPLAMGTGSSAEKRSSSPSLDRIDSTKGYEPGNVRMISWRANRLKGDATLAEVEALARYLRGEI